MLRMCYDIQIGSYHLKGIHSITVESSIDLLSDQCSIVLSGMAHNMSLNLEDKVKRGDPVIVHLGYDDNLHTEFKGYLRSIYPNSPMKLECEDAIYLFRKRIADKQFKKASATIICRYIVEQINKQLPKEQKMKFITDIKAKGFEFEKFTIVGATGMQALEKLKSETGYSIYCRGRELHMHPAYTEKRGNVTYDFARNIETSDGLEYVKAEDVRTRVKVVGRNQKGHKVEVETGEKGGNTIEIKLPTVASKASLLKRAEGELKRVCYDGYKGAIRGWLIPFCGIGYSATILDRDYPKREGVYFVNAVKTEFSREGGVRTVTLGIRLNNKAATSTPAAISAPVVAPTPEPADLPDPNLPEDEGDEEGEPGGVWA